MRKVKVSNLKLGDVIMPPRAERRWMRKTAAEWGLPPESAHLIVTDVKSGFLTDRRGEWVIITTRHTDAWLARYSNPDPVKNRFVFTARPSTLWDVVEVPE